ncbi:Metallo-dependent phosphatase-like protein [Zopfochytrium polystomum]|nr:Metallo-dependent phosphatase-like protein [Zopfochytrium polystomum]
MGSKVSKPSSSSSSSLSSAATRGCCRRLRCCTTNSSRSSWCCCSHRISITATSSSGSRSSVARGGGSHGDEGGVVVSSPPSPSSPPVGGLPDELSVVTASAPSTSPRQSSPLVSGSTGTVPSLSRRIPPTPQSATVHSLGSRESGSGTPSSSTTAADVESRFRNLADAVAVGSTMELSALCGTPPPRRRIKPRSVGSTKNTSNRNHRIKYCLSRWPDLTVCRDAPCLSLLSRFTSSLSSTPTPTDASASPALTNATVDSKMKFDVDDFIQRLLGVRKKKVSARSVCLKPNEIVAICGERASCSWSSRCCLNSTLLSISLVTSTDNTKICSVFSMHAATLPLGITCSLGDYVDRGKQSLETILLLLCYKIKFPKIFSSFGEITRLRRSIGCMASTTSATPLQRKGLEGFHGYLNCLRLLQSLAARFSCVHGGLSPSLYTMDDIRILPRPFDVPEYGLFNDLLWADPSDTVNEWGDNERGVSYCFGQAIVKSFLEKHGLELVARAHMVVENGYEFFAERRLSLITKAR